MLGLFGRVRHAATKRTDLELDLCQRIALAALAHGSFTRSDHHTNLVNSLQHMPVGNLFQVARLVIAIEAIAGARQ